ncbi:hypothetical protein HZA45_03620 [Candidatus Peregrinibacteria bacterium]|nr:hypothetical protein [Candidatus Peregrinibacteria bacterium]
MEQSCNECRVAFSITDDDLAFYEKISPKFNGKQELIPPPTLCPDCRQRKRVAQGNLVHLYKRKCDLTGVEMVTNYHPDAPYKVYKQTAWWSDKWDAMEYGREVDFSLPFFEQYAELLLVVPRYSLHTTYEFDENAEYTNYATTNKNSYLIFDSDFNENCYYCFSMNHCVSCMDCFRTRKSELCYGCIDSWHCYSSAFLQDCENCSDSMFLKNCIGCKNCLMCSNLRNKEYCVENKQVTKEEFEKFRALLNASSTVEAARERFDTLKLEYPQRFMHGVNNEDILGDYLTNCKNADHCFDSTDLWDCKYSYQGWEALKDSMDVQELGMAELIFESCYGGFNSQRLLFSSHCFGSHDLLYCTYCVHSGNLFGCVGLNRKEYCIFNKQYTQEEYEKLVPKIIDSMRNTQEWGEFFPIPIASFAYNETLAQDYFPMKKEDALRKGYKWRDEDQRDFKPATMELPDATGDLKDSVTKEMLACKTCTRNFKIIPQELVLLRQIHVPPPHDCFFCRHKKRFVQRNPRTIYARTCAKCKKAIQTTYAPDRPEIVYCEECYLKEVY